MGRLLVKYPVLVEQGKKVHLQLLVPDVFGISHHLGWYVTILKQPILCLHPILVVIVHLLDIIVVDDDSLFFKDSGVGGVAISASVVSSMPMLPTLLSL